MIGERLKMLRQERGYSLTKLAKEAGVSKSYLSYLERDLRDNPSLQFLSKITDTLDVSIDYLLDVERKEEKKPDDLNNDLMDLFKHAADDGGISKGDLEEFREFIKFKNWQTANKE